MHDFTDRIHREVAIENYISRFVNLKKKGKRYTGLCPFHQEKSPSFTVSPDVQLYYCFGCHKSGDIFRFVMDFEKVDFNRAKEVLSEYSGIPLQQGKRESFDSLYNLNKKVADFYHKTLLSDFGKPALEYLHSRNIIASDIELFQIGYALPGYENLVQKMNASEITDALKLGLIRERPKMKGSYYDFFRDRIMFPISDQFGKVVGFGGRILTASGEAKYINSATSVIYDKGKMFYNLNHAADPIRREKKAILVEGYMDVIGLASRNITNVVAPLGTALTVPQLRLIRNFTDSIVLMMDGDNAGRKAALASCELALNEGIDTSVLILQHGDDPFDLSRKNTAAELKEIIKTAGASSTFMLDQAMEGVTPSSSPEEKKKAVKNLFEFVSRMSREIDKQTFLQEGAARIGVSETYVLQDFLKEKGSKSTPPDSDRYKHTANPGKPGLAGQCERKMMALLIKEPELFTFANEINSLEFQDEESAFIWDFIYTRYLNQESLLPGDIIMAGGKNESAIAPYLLELGDEEHDFKLSERMFQELMLRQKVAVLDRKLDDLSKNGMFDDEMQRISKMAYYKGEKEKILGYIRTLE